MNKKPKCKIINKKENDLRLLNECDQLKLAILTDLADSNEIVYFNAMGSTNFKINKLSVLPRHPLESSDSPQCHPPYSTLFIYIFDNDNINL